MIKPEDNRMTFKLLKINNLNTRIQLPPKLCLRNEGEVKVFQTVLVFYCSYYILPQILWHKQYKFTIILQFYRSQVQDQSHWTTIKSLAGLNFFISEEKSYL